MLHGGHRQLDQISRRTLHRCIDRRAFRALAPRCITAADFRQPQPAAEYGFDITLLARLFAGDAHVLGDTRITLEITVHVLLCRRTLDIELAGKAERRHAVDQTKIDDLGVTALLVIHGLRCEAENLRSRRAMDVLAGSESLQQAFIARDVRHDAQLDLRIVRGNNAGTGRRNKRLADAPALCRANGNVLQVGIGARQPPGHRRRLAVTGMHATGVAIDHERQFVGVGQFELGQPAIFEDQFRQRMIERQFRQRFLVGGRRAAGRFFDRFQALLVEQDFLNLFRRTEVERLPRLFMRAFFDVDHLGAKLGRQFRQQFAVDQHAVAFHRIQHRHRRHFDVGINMVQFLIGGDARMQRLMQLQRDVRIFSGIFTRLLHRDLFETDAFRASPRNIVITYCFY